MFSLANNLPPILSAYTAFTGFAFLIRTILGEFKAIVNQILPGEIRARIWQKLERVMTMCNFTSQMTMVIEEYNGLTPNEIFEASEVYLRSKLGTLSTNRLKICKATQEANISFVVSRNEKINDTFEGAEFIWEMKVAPTSSRQKPSNDYDVRPPSEVGDLRSFELTFNKEIKGMVLTSYIPFVLKKSKELREKEKMIKLLPLGNWHEEVCLDHPSTFKTLAMDPDLKRELIEDLDRFVRRREYYRRVGKAWKRGYLLYGPPGTGKSSLIAAMANYLKFDIFDLDLTGLKSNSELQVRMPMTKNRSILVIEDIDCNIEARSRNLVDNTHKESQLTLSGLLNFIDGLWSCCGDERIIVFTTNCKERLDPALLRPRRMDIHIHMSYCTPSAFRVLASNYHGLNDHSTFVEIDKLLSETDVTPGEIAEELMKCENADIALEGLIKFIQKKKGAHEDYVVEDINCPF
ncbi:unnamed protein product [Cuscuta campestris]|uniref:AAA+ ATPase domain-containing protein n=1 Tax=Cuscuta campestris TaxID=132261 RepID=A0A484MWB6_9ASTE|nr:unnamed protein product [Cuscuta campestris]